MSKNYKNTFINDIDTTPFASIEYDDILTKIYISTNKAIQTIQIDICKTFDTDKIHKSFPKDEISEKILLDLKNKIEVIQEKYLNKNKDTIYSCNTLLYLISYKHNTCLIKKHWNAYDFTQDKPCYCPTQSLPLIKEKELCQSANLGDMKKCNHIISEFNAGINIHKDTDKIKTGLCGDPCLRNAQVADRTINNINRKI